MINSKQTEREEEEKKKKDIKAREKYNSTQNPVSIFSVDYSSQIDWLFKKERGEKNGNFKKSVFIDLFFIFLKVKMH